MSSKVTSVVSSAMIALGFVAGACNTLETPALQPPDQPAAPSHPVATIPPAVAAANPAGSACLDAACGIVPPALVRPTVQADEAPPAISGGTLIATADGALLVASDPDRDQIYFIDARARALLHVRALEPGDEPGRLVEDAAGRIHVALRAGHAIASLTREPDGAIERRAACDLPRGLAYDAARDSLQIACAEGKVVSLPAAVGGEIERTVEVARDVRDIAVRGAQRFVTRFRSAELLELGEGPDSQFRRLPPSSTSRETPGSVSEGQPSLENTPGSAWRMLDIPGRGVTLLHQRARTAAVEISPGGYGAASSCGSGIVQTSITTGLDTGEPLSVDLQGATLAVDMAADPAGEMLAIVAPGNWGGGRQIHLVSLTGTSELNVNAPDLVKRGVPNAVASAVSSTQPLAQRPCISAGSIVSEPEGQATAITFVSSSELAIQLREPAGIAFVDLRSNETQTLDLAQPSRFDTGHTMFHLRAQSGLACASCHPEAGDDGHVWTFVGIGPRRTQSLRGGILGTEPFHWNGDMHDFAQLVQDVFVQRMSGFSPSAEQASALSSWIDRQPAYASRARDDAAMQRGKALFESDALGCNGCHSGPHFTDNRTLWVGTGVLLQVPSLRAVSFRTPLMHDGCAASLRDRFGSCGGGDMHGHTSQLGASEIDDLLDYLETL